MSTREREREREREERERFVPDTGPAAKDPIPQLKLLTPKLAANFSIPNRAIRTTGRRL